MLTFQFRPTYGTQQSYRPIVSPSNILKSLPIYNRNIKPSPVAYRIVRTRSWNVRSDQMTAMSSTDLAERHTHYI